MLAKYDRDKVIAAASGAADEWRQAYEEAGLQGNDKEQARRWMEEATDIAMGALYAEGPTVTLHMKEFKLLHMYWPTKEAAPYGKG